MERREIVWNSIQRESFRAGYRRMDDALYHDSLIVACPNHLNPEWYGKGAGARFAETGITRDGFGDDAERITLG